MHSLFKGAVRKYRPDLDLDRIATGEHWYGARAIELGLVDEIKTSDELLAEFSRNMDIYRVAYKIKQPLEKRLMAKFDGALDRVDNLNWRRHFESRLPR